ncbi:tetratricopeptide repeat protein [Amycolatopsis sp. OK19-0408]|uniref:Tetratricopeptide repeat protein n=1 Tax=Amycolatopsis iheyensis TaxID=2945988 RepID=A0A9X2N9S9_9PSEU|nr:tetratricopeptide repeat protein [Amycolatopsis iheyensis]MCR6483216.1 tetratricopeptide repeat protein [Amycolatopsis iheyensis]
MSHRPEVPPEGGTANHVAGDVSGSLVQAGVVNGNFHFHPQPRRVVALPYRAGVAPQPAAAFQERAGTTHLLVQALASGNASVLTGQHGVHTGVVSGLGGVGKTQVALDYAQRVWAAGEVDVWLWITAGSREAIVSGYARLAADLTGVEDSDPELGARRLLEWLATGSARWLIVLDDLQNPADLRGLWPPAVPDGRVVVTTRRRDAALRGHGRCLVEVGVFTPVEAEGYLRAALAHQPLLADGAAELAAELGYLPLALAQAAAYMLDRSLACTGYRERWNSRRRSLASLLPEPDGLPDEHRATVAATWSLSVEQANRLEPAGIAGTLLEVAGVLDPNGIPAALFTTSAITELLARRTGGEIDAEQARDGLGCLHRLNLITLDPHSDTRTVRVHALVQRATREALPSHHYASLTDAAAEALLAIWPNPERDTALGQVLCANTEVLAAAAGEHLWKPHAHPVLFRVGNSLGGRGLAAEARCYFLRLHTTATKQLGPDHPQTLTTRSRLARWRAEAGDPAGAAAETEQVLADRLRVLGPEHRDTLAARHDLARWRGVAGDPAGSVAALERLLEDLVRVLGRDHLETLTARANAAHLRGEAGDPAGAAAATEQLLDDLVRVLGRDHRNTLAARNNLARWRGAAGDPAGAVAATEQLLADRLRVLGPDHPNTLTTRHNLAHWQGAAGDPAAAVAAFEQLLTDRLRVLGPDHPQTLTTRHGLAGSQGRAGDPAAAAAAFEQLLTDRMRVQGPDHPDTLTARSNLVRWRGEAGDPAAAAAAAGQLLTDRLRVLGPDHPHTLTTRHSLAHWRGVAGDPAAAAAAFEQLLTDRMRVLGPDHPETLTTRRNLAYWRARLSESQPS